MKEDAGEIPPDTSPRTNKVTNHRRLTPKGADVGGALVSQKVNETLILSGSLGWTVTGKLFPIADSIWGTAADGSPTCLLTVYGSSPGRKIS